MSFECEQIAPLLRSFSLVTKCDVIKDGSVRIATPFRYPNGSLIDVFLTKKNDLFHKLELSDNGQASDYLLDLQIKLWANAKRKTLVSDVCKALDVINEDGVLKINFQEDESDLKLIPEYLVRLAQACIRVTDIAFTQRFRTQGTFVEEVEEFIASTELIYQPSFSVLGCYGKEVDFDFKVKGKHVESLVHTVPTQSLSPHMPAAEVFTRWYDVRNQWDKFQKITVFDSTKESTLRSDDIERLSEVSEVVAFPAEESRLKEMLAA